VPIVADMGRKSLLRRSTLSHDKRAVQLWLTPNGQHLASVQSSRRNGTPEDQAGVVSFLAGGDCRCRGQGGSDRRRPIPRRRGDLVR
jgi:hypothetical protein